MIIPDKFFINTKSYDDDRRVIARLLAHAGLLPPSVVIEGREVDFTLSNCDVNETVEAFDHIEIHRAYDNVVEVACYPKGTVCLHELTVNEVDEAVKGVRIENENDNSQRYYNNGEAFKKLKEVCLERWLKNKQSTMTADLGGKEVVIKDGLNIKKFIQALGAETLMDIFGLNIGFVACIKEEKDDEKD